jgi:serine phosphatase RsbU (regulator of sigma subunit)
VTTVERFTRRADVREAVAVGVLLLAVFVARLVVAEPLIGVGFLYVVPVAAAALWFGRLGGVAVGVVATALYLVGAVLVRQEYLVPGAALRLAVFCAVGYSFAELVERERRLSRDLALQARELEELRAVRAALVPPEVPERPAVELATCFLPAQERVAGDFFFIGEAPNDATIVVVGDVVGKGLEAARRAAFVRAALAAYAPYDDDPRRLLELANTALVERAGISQEFVTAACLVYRPADRSMSWALAGHPAPMLLDEGRRLNGISAGLPLGLGERVEYERGDGFLGAGGGVLLFTDGLLEARRPREHDAPNDPAPDAPPPDLFGSERIAAVLTTHRGGSPGEVVEALRAAAERFTGGRLDDDLCMVGLRAR